MRLYSEVMKNINKRFQNILKINPSWLLCFEYFLNILILALRWINGKF